VSHKKALGIFLMPRANLNPVRNKFLICSKISNGVNFKKLVFKCFSEREREGLVRVIVFFHQKGIFSIYHFMISYGKFKRDLTKNLIL
jgi:hypothetical protein